MKGSCTQNEICISNLILLPPMMQRFSWINIYPLIKLTKSTIYCSDNDTDKGNVYHILKRLVCPRRVSQPKAQPATDLPTQPAIDQPKPGFNPKTSSTAALHFTHGTSLTTPYMYLYILLQSYFCSSFNWTSPLSFEVHISSYLNRLKHTLRYFN